MIRINLLKKTVRHRPERRKAGPKVYVLTASGLGAVSVIALGIWLVPKLMKKEPPKQYAVEENLRPSTYSKAHAVEEVVRERDDTGDKLKMSGVLALPYEELSQAEKVNYEIYFAKNVCDLLAKAVPEGVGFQTLTLDKFRSVRGVTLTASRELITQMIKGLREGNVDPFPRPQSIIRQKAKGFEFTFIADAQFGLDLRAPFVDTELRHLASRDAVSYEVKKISEAAAACGVHISGNIEKISAESQGQYRVFRYALRGVSSYAQFVQFVAGLHEKRIACAFETCTLTAQTPSRLTIDARIQFTTVD